MVRTTTPFFYTLELLVALSGFLIVLFLFVKDIDKKSLYVFLLAGVVNSSIEFFLQGVGLREIDGAFLFGTPIGFPFIPFILGFYEGGVKTLIAYHFTRMVVNSDRLSKKVLVSLLCIVFIPFFSYSVIESSALGSPIQTVTVRELFNLLPILLLALAFAVSISYFLFNKDLPRLHKKSLLYYELGLVIYLLVWMIPLHLFLFRFIGVFDGGTYVPAGIMEQLVVMY